MAFKIAYGAGHFLDEPGKRIPAKLDAAQTREWTLNDRVARYFAEAAGQYENVELLRVDDPTGKTWNGLLDRCRKANAWGADMCLAIHHNAAYSDGRTFDGGGIVAYSYKEGTKGAEYRDEIYAACISAGGLRGDRYDPTQAKGFYVLVNTNAPAVLMEYGFMDSVIDAPVILTEAYSKLVGYATMEGIAKAAGLRKKTAQAPAATKPTTSATNAANKTMEACSVNLPVLENGNEGASVKALQQLLLANGYKMQNNGKTYSTDGIFGAATDKALRAYQKAHGLEADGICGPLTWSSLLGVA